jgi:peptide-methionine (S)-S-oxide reductase
MDKPMTETATLAGGCFWCVETIFDQLRGVLDVTSGYTGGERPNPTYEQVCSGATGHAEAIQVSFDPEIISYKDILRIFFSVHDPTTLNRQGGDIGTQYRSAIFYNSEQQKKEAEEVIAELDAQGVWERPIVTEVTAASTFYAAEDYHQEYYERNPNQGYCTAVISPKVMKFRKTHYDKLKR